MSNIIWAVVVIGCAYAGSVLGGMQSADLPDSLPSNTETAAPIHPEIQK
jgi:hypothetical protein